MIERSNACPKNNRNVIQRAQGVELLVNEPDRRAACAHLPSELALGGTPPGACGQRKEETLVAAVGGRAVARLVTWTERTLARSQVSA